MDRQSEEIERIPSDVIHGRDAAAALASGEALVKLENTVQMQIAIANKRDEKAILKAAMDELETYAACAEQAIYSKPVGRSASCPSCEADISFAKVCPKCGKPNPQTFARGLSIRAAESLANRWDNSSWGCQQVADDGNSVTIVAIFLDYQRNIRHAIPKRVARSYKTRFGTVKTHADDRFNDLVVPAATSRILREVILRSLPAGLKEEYRLKAEKMCAITTDEAKRRMLSMFSELKVTREMIEGLMGKPVAKLSGQDMLNLRGIYNAIEAKEQTVEEAFDLNREPERAEPETVKGAPSLSGLTGQLTGQPPQKPPESESAPEVPPAEPQKQAAPGRKQGKAASKPTPPAEGPKSDLKLASDEAKARIAGAIKDDIITQAYVEARCKVLGIDGTKWEECSPKLMSKLANDLMV